MPDTALPDKIARRLRRDILRGDLQPGAPIKERDSAAELGVSRTPLREALRILAREGLVCLRPARSPLVADPSLREVSDAIEVLRVLETFSGERACARATEGDLAAIEALHQRMIAAHDQCDPLDVFEIDMEFHLAIVRAAHNPALAETHRAYLARLWRVRYLSAQQRRAREVVVAQHEAVVAGLRARDAARVCAELDRHLERLQGNVTHLFEMRAAKDAAPRATLS